MNDDDLLSDAAQEQRIRCCGVASTHDNNRLSLVEHSVACRAVGHTPSDQFLFVRNTEFPGICTRRQYNGLAIESSLAGFDCFRAGIQIDAAHFGILRLGAKAFSLPLHLIRQFPAADAVHKSRIVVDLVGQRHLSACGELFDHQRIEPCSCCVQRCRVSAGSSSDDDHVVNVIVFFLYLFGKDVGKEFINDRLGFRCNGRGHGLTVHIQPERGDQFDLQFTPKLVILVHINLYHFKYACVLLCNLLVCRVDLAAMRAPRCPEIYQKSLSILNHFLELLRVYIHSCHCASPFRFVRSQYTRSGVSLP